MLRNCKDTESLDSTTIHMHTRSQSESPVSFICISLDRGRSQSALGLEARIGQLEEAEEESGLNGRLVAVLLEKLMVNFGCILQL